MRPSKKSVGGTSFHNHVFGATVSELREMLGKPSYDANGEGDKVNFEWTMETEDGEVFTVYDWKYYRPLPEDELVEWHIGGHSAKTTLKALQEIGKALQKLSPKA